MGAPIVKRTSIKTGVGVEVSQVNMSLFCDADTMQGNLPLAQFARQGGFDGATLTITRNFFAHWNGQFCGSLNLFVGDVGQVTCSSTEVALQINATTELFDTLMPRNVYGASCMHTLFDTGCTLTKAAFTSTGNTTANSTTANVHCNLAQADGYFSLGVMQFTSGQNNQVQRSIRLHANGVLYPVLPFLHTPQAGDLFTVRPGCDKQQPTCAVKFSNSANFRGYRFIPAPEATY